jgi:hypothetical protein
MTLLHCPELCPGGGRILLLEGLNVNVSCLVVLLVEDLCCRNSAI